MDYFIFGSFVNFADGDIAPKEVGILEVSGLNLGGKTIRLVLTQNFNVIGSATLKFSGSGGGTGEGKPDAIIGTVLSAKKRIKKTAGEDIYSTDSSQSVSKSVKPKKGAKKASFYVGFQNDGDERDTFTCHRTGHDRKRLRE